MPAAIDRCTRKPVNLADWRLQRVNRSSPELPECTDVRLPDPDAGHLPRGDASQQMLVLCIGVAALYVVLGVVAWVLH